MKFLSLLPATLLLAAPATAQVVSEGFDTGNTHNWGLELTGNGVFSATGGNPGARITVAVESSMSNLPAAMVMPSSPGNPWSGDFRLQGISGFRFDRQVELGSSNFGTRLFVVLGQDNGTPTNFGDDIFLFYNTGDIFQFGMVPWATISAPIDSASNTIPAGWEVEALPNSPLGGNDDNSLWNTVITDVSYVGIAMGRPWNGGAWFGAHMISFDNIALDGPSELGMRYCTPGVPNSTGASGSITVTGSPVAASNDVTLTANDLPPSSFGFFLTSQMQGLVANPGGSQGNLCLGGAIGRYVGPGQILNSGAAGSISLVLDLTQTPTPTGLVTVAAGETWNFQGWHRDSVMGMSTSNFTDAVSVMFL